MTSKIKFVNLKKYLEMNGWDFDYINDKFTKISKNFDEPITLLIPNDEILPDYIHRVYDIIQTISDLEERDFKELFEEIKNMGYDLMKIRFVANKTKEGTIPLNDFIGAMDNVKKMLTFSACSEIQEKSQYRKPYTDVIDLIGNCEFSQTESGSFVISIRVPLGRTYLVEIDDRGKLKDLGRKTVARIVNGIKEVEEMTIENEDDFREQYDLKLNRNVCDAISKILMEEEGFDVDINVNWDKTELSEINLPEKVKIQSAQYYKKFNRMASYLRKIPEEEDVTIIGVIKKLQRQEVDQNTEKKLITVDVSALKRKVYLYLNEEYHREACNAYREGQRI